MNYKVGDTPTVKSDLETTKSYKVGCFNNSMYRYEGEKITISHVEHNYYRIAEDGGIWTWTDEMFENKVTIKTWEDLDEIKNNRYRISIEFSKIYAYELISPFSITYLFIEEDKPLILDWLSTFGFNVEFEKHPNLTAKEMDIVKGLIALDFYYLTNLDGDVYAKNHICTNLLIPINTFKFISNTKAFSLAYLVLLEVSDV